nr:transposase [Acaryochloris sp. CCMEE 5410]
MTNPSNHRQSIESNGLSLKNPKVKPLKKLPQTDAIFANVAQANYAADAAPNLLRISIDSKAKVKIGNLSRGGKARTLDATKANDHDDHWDAILVPFGILDVLAGQLSIYFGQSAETTDFIVDCLEAWWREHHDNYPQIEGLEINLDGGSAVRSNRTQFIKRMVEFVQMTRLSVHLIYYPPYHSKYNPIERCWAALEQYWNGTILNSIDTAVQWASNMTWNGLKPLVHLIEGTYEKNITVPSDELEAYKQQWLCSEALPKWDIKIVPN